MNPMLTNVIGPLLPLLSGGPEALHHREFLDDPYMPPAAQVAEPTSTLPVAAGSSFVQVSVNAMCNNIMGDAANEP